jgi:hypothetical protein
VLNFLLNIYTPAPSLCIFLPLPSLSSPSLCLFVSFFYNPGGDCLSPQIFPMFSPL